MLLDPRRFILALSLLSDHMFYLTQMHTLGRAGKRIWGSLYNNRGLQTQFIRAYWRLDFSSRVRYLRHAKRHRGLIVN